ncbi:acylglycerone-phosphate reductase [Sugiyamaella lignohabitans]|uniref:Acylglycerone-phosphate reductase n=1 Tax=Sugiyamaella lignohabitans TaxID=796027 RepID=A0A167CF93_9ASCO|nr:acylglycerone-phosphate reductase [Sugiyamaella lignohabitans]ANB11613.1 acylglycerone-phosphate reductase [Sugiyamaella lignohabitans]
MPFSLKQGHTAVIIGSATGIGRAAARKWASQGVKLALFDKSQERLSILAKELESKTTVLSVSGDASKFEEVKDFQKAVVDKFGTVDLLFLNAGISGKSDFTHPDPVRTFFETNFFGVVNGVSAFVETLKKQSTESHVIITGSKQGITNPPGNPGYNASKAAVKSYAEGLSFDLQGSPVEAHLLVPGWTHTFLTGDRETAETAKPAGAWYPEQVVERLEQGLDKDEFYIFCEDNDVTTELDFKRMQYNLNDILLGRPALSRWRPEYKSEFEAFIKK